MSATILTPATRYLYDAWFAEALKDDGVWPYMSFSKRTAPYTIDGDDWDRLLVIDPTRTALLVWTNDRTNGLNDANLCLWSLSRPVKHLAAGRVAAMIPVLARRFGVSYVGAACHASNVDSIRMMTKRLGTPWGRCPDNAWNPQLGRFEDTLHFRAAAVWSAR